MLRSTSNCQPSKRVVHIPMFDHTHPQNPNFTLQTKVRLVMICVCGDCSSVVFAETNSRLALSPRFDVAPSVTDALDCTWQMWSRKLPKWWSIHTPPLYTVYYSIIFNQFETRISLTYPWGITGDPNDISMESMGISYFSHRARR